MERPTTKDRIMTALFHDREDAEHAFDDLRKHGFSARDISVVMSEDTRDRHYASEPVETEMGNKATEGAGVGGAIGGTIGGIVGAIAAAAAPVVFPGIGIVLSGPLAAALAGAGAGGLGGSLLGGLIGAGIPEERVKEYQKGIKEGGILLGVKPRTEQEAERVNEVFDRYNGILVH